MRHKERLFYEGFVTLAVDIVDRNASDILYLTPKQYTNDLYAIPEEDEEGLSPLVEILKDKIKGSQVTIQFWVSATKITHREARDITLNQLLGIVDAEYGHHYGDFTGYLWTDEELNIGGHDLLAIIKTYRGSYFLLEIFVH